MRAVVMEAIGGPEVLVTSEVPVPSPGPGEVLLRVEAAAVSAGETRMRSGAIAMPFPLPLVFGAEAVGVVAALGEGVDASLAGRRLVGVTGGRGSYADYAVVNPAMMTAVPDGLAPVDAVALAAPGAMAFGLVRKAAPRAGETVLIEGGSGKIGGYLVPLVSRSARVIATASTAEGRERARALGAGEVIDHSTPDWPGELAPGTIDVAFDLAGGAVAGRLLDALRPSTGRMLMYASMSGEPTVLDGAKIRDRGLQVTGCGGPGWAADIFGIDLPAVLAAAARGEVGRPAIEAVLPLTEAAEAHRRMEAGRLAGRIVLVP